LKKKKKKKKKKNQIFLQHGFEFGDALIYAFFASASDAAAADGGASLTTILFHRSNKPAPKKFTATNLSTLFQCAI
jgi:hypothetical protein